MSAPKLNVDAATLQQLIRAACEARDTAYAAYSNHPVGSAILDDMGRISVGCNIENAAYPLGNCAEPVAIANMHMSGGREIRHLVVAGPGLHLCTPCGGCRQRIREFAGKGVTQVSVVDKDGNLQRTFDFYEDLLPESFGPDNVQEVN